MNLLAVYWDVDPVIVSLGKIQIRYYSLFFIIAFTIGYYLFKYFFKREQVRLNSGSPALYTYHWNAGGEHVWDTVCFTSRIITDT